MISRTGLDGMEWIPPTQQVTKSDVWSGLPSLDPPHVHVMWPGFHGEEYQ
jgi:hypothetical protein